MNLVSLPSFLPYCAPLDLIKAGKPAAVDALQLCSLLLPQTNRTRLHRVLRLIHKASSNRQLVLSKTKSNREVLLEHFSSIVLKQESHSISPLHIPAFHKSDSSADCGSGSGSGRGRGGAKSEEEKESLKRLVGFMSHHYQQIFKVQLCKTENCVDFEVACDFCHLFRSQIPDNLRREVQKRLDLLSSGKVIE